MASNGKGTRAEAVDLYNAISDGVDGLVLGDACTDGAYPLESVSATAKMCAEAEANTDYKRLFSEMVQYSCSPATTAEAVACSAVSAVNELNVALIIVLTDSGKLGRLVCKYKPSVPVMICSQQQHVVEQLNLTRGTVGFKIPESALDDLHIKMCIDTAKDRGYVEAQQKVIVIEGRMEESPDEENISQIIEITH
jgi:pyruvate kinase